jgi:hypothetical protein
MRRRSGIGIEDEKKKVGGFKLKVFYFISEKTEGVV